MLFPSVLSHTDVRENLFTTSLLFQVREKDQVQKVTAFSNTRHIMLGCILQQQGHSVCMTFPRITLLICLHVKGKTTILSSKNTQDESTPRKTQQIIDQVGNHRPNTALIGIHRSHLGTERSRTTSITSDLKKSRCHPVPQHWLAPQCIIKTHIYLLTCCSIMKHFENSVKRCAD